MSVYATARVHRSLEANSIFNVLDATRVARPALVLEQETELQLPDGARSGITVTPFPVPGKVALWLEDASAADFGSIAEDSIGLRVSEPASGRSFFYVPGCASLPPSLAKRLSGAALVLFDGTTWTDDEMQATGVGEKTGRRMGHMSMAGPGGSIEAFAGLDVARRVFIHINNTNPVLLARSPQRREAEAAGWEIAFDGQEISP